LELIYPSKFFKKLKLHEPLRRKQFQRANWTRKTVWLLNNSNMTKFSWRKCRKTFLEAIFSHSRKLSSKLLHKIFLIFYVISLASKISYCVSANHIQELRCAICTGVTLFALCYTWTALLSADHHRVIFSCTLLKIRSISPRARWYASVKMKYTILYFRYKKFEVYVELTQKVLPLTLFNR